MKLIRTLLTGIIIFITFPAFSQDPITITSSCSNPDSHGEYTLNGTVNGKPSYMRGEDCSEFIDRNSCIAASYYYVSWSGSRWEWYKGVPYCVWLVQICVPNSIEEENAPDDLIALIASNTADSPIPPCFGWVAEPDYCVPILSTGCICFIADQFDQGDTTFCNGTGTIESASSQIGFNYYLRNDQDNSVVDGPHEGTGSGITFNTGTVTASTVYNLYASSSVDSAGCNKEMISKITVNPTLDITVTNSNPELTANNTGASYQWLDCNNNYAILSGEINQSFTASANGNYAVEITKNGCTDTSDCEAVTITAIMQNEFGKQLEFSPNPTNSGYITITLGSIYSNIMAIVKNSMGQEVLRKNISSANRFDLTLEGNPGIYLIEIESGDNKALLKVIKE